MKPGDVVRGKYRVKRQLGEGGMGVVVRATHLKLDQDVALKLLKPEMVENANVVERFTREAKAAARLRGDHVVRILDVEEGEGGAPFIVMEYLEGADLERLVRRDGPLSAERATVYALEACEGLAEAHALGIVHRDVKPANLFLAKTPRGGETVKLLDFGISKAGRDRDPTITEADRVLGSPSFMSPEQVKAARDVDARTDVWSLGVVLYFLLTGRLPFPGASATAVAARIASDPPDPIGDDLPAALCLVVERCLEKDPDRRFGSIEELARALAPFTSDGEKAAARVASLARMPAAPPAAGSGSVASTSSASVIAAERVTASLGALAAAKPAEASVDAPAPVSKSAPPPSSPPAESPWRRRVVVGLALAALGGIAWLVTRKTPEPATPPVGAAPAPSTSVVDVPAVDASMPEPVVSTPAPTTAKPSVVRPPAPSPKPAPSASTKPAEDPLKLDLK